MWCNSKPNDCTRKDGAIFAHSTSALTRLKGLELGICRKDMKISIMKAFFLFLTNFYKINKIIFCLASRREQRILNQLCHKWNKNMRMR